MSELAEPVSEFDRLAGVVCAIDLSAFPVELELAALENLKDPSKVLLEVKMTVCHRLTGARTSFYRSSELPIGVTMIVDWVFARVREIVEHELRESFIFDGERVFDPHVEAQYRRDPEVT